MKHKGLLIIPVSSSCFGHLFYPTSGALDCVLKLVVYVVCPKSKCTCFLFRCLLDSPEITSYVLQSMTLGKLHSGSNVFFHCS